MTVILDQAPVLLVALPLFCVPLLYFADHALGFPVRPTALGMYTVLALFALATAITPESPAEGIVVAVGGWHADVGIELALDPMARLFLPAIAGISLLGVIAVTPRQSTSTYYTLFFLILAGSNGLVLTRDLFNAYVFIEITSIASYALVGFRQDRRGFESAFKYLLVGSLASLMILWGIAGLYAVAGSLSLPVLAERLNEGPQRLVAGSGALITAGLLVKLGIVPFHAWKPDAMAGAPRPVAATLSGATVTAFFLLFVRVYAMLQSMEGTAVVEAAGLPAAFELSGHGSIGRGARIPVVLAVFAGASILLGHLMALRQTKLPRLLAYSSIAHFGYMLAGVVAGTQAALAAALLHALHHGVMKAGLFHYASVSGERRSNAGSPEAGRSMGSGTTRLGRLIPVISLVVLSMGMIGIPPTAGFSSKWLVVIETARSGNIHPALGGMLAGLIALGGAIALMYYLRFALLAGSHGQPQPRRSVLALAICVIYTLVAFWFTDSLGEFASLAAAGILEP